MSLSKTSAYLRVGILGALGAPVLIVVLHGLGYKVTLWGCPLKALVGIPCPTWGMTRAIFAIANTQWSTALQYHLLAPLVILLWAIAIVQVSLELMTRRVWSRWWQRRSVWGGGLTLLFGYHGYRLYHLWISGELIFLP
ncbi:MAG: DUF2752 domain-containing protein [Leptolyngbyaceae cyanobacterium]|mgnify:CR=1 FL=1